MWYIIQRKFTFLTPVLYLLIIFDVPTPVARITVGKSSFEKKYRMAKAIVTKNFPTMTIEVIRIFLFSGIGMMQRSDIPIEEMPVLTNISQYQ